LNLLRAAERTDMQLQTAV